jgi:FixJ family two-component response regulator
VFAIVNAVHERFTLVKTHRAHIMEKTEAESLTHLVPVSEKLKPTHHKYAPLLLKE